MTITLIFEFFSGCNFIYKDNGQFGHSQTKQEALKNGSQVFEYLSEKDTFKLLDGTMLNIDTAWTEVSFSYHNGERILDSTFGYLFSIPFKKAIPKSFTFNFSLADKTNEGFTNGNGEELCQLCPSHLYNEMTVLLVQKNPDNSKGWTNPIVTDTIKFKRIENQN